MKIKAAVTQIAAEENTLEMVEKHAKMVEEAARKGVQVICFQELFSNLYFCVVEDYKWFDLAEPVPGPTTDRMCQLAKKHEMVIVVPIYEFVQPGIYYNTAVVIDADGTILGKYRKTHMPHVAECGHEKLYFKPGNLGYPVFQTRYCKLGVYICYDRHFPEGARILGLNGAELVFIPAATTKGVSNHLWFIEQRALAIANGYYVGTCNRVGVEPLTERPYYGSSYFSNPSGEILAQGSEDKDEIVVAELDLDLIRKVRMEWAFYRDRRVDLYGPLTIDKP